MLDGIKSFFRTKFGYLLALFLLSGLIAVATQIGCKPCTTFLSGVLTDVESTASANTTEGIQVDAPAAAQ